MDKTWTREDLVLGMDRSIDRRDFLHGVSLVGIGALANIKDAKATVSASGFPQDKPGYYPPTLTGMRGSHPGSFENAHAMRDGVVQTAPHNITETYDLVIVGAGISGLSAAYFYRQNKPDARILILDNHDDFGGHAKRNEFMLDGKLHLMNGGTLMIDSPRPYSAVADGLIKALGISPEALAKTCNDEKLYASLGMEHAMFFDQETFGKNALVVGTPTIAERGDGVPWSEFLAKAPLSDAAKADIIRVETHTADIMQGLNSAQKKDKLSRISYQDFLLHHHNISAEALKFYQSRTKGEWSVGIDAVSALDCWGFGFSGFEALKLDPGAAPRMSTTAAGYADGGSYRFHFPDGNATIARLLVRSLIPAAISGHNATDVVKAPTYYAMLDKHENSTRLRLSSTVTRVHNNANIVNISYRRGDNDYTVSAKNCVLACWNMLIPYLCPELPEKQKAALHQCVKSPLVYTTVALKNWQAFHKLGFFEVSAPGGYYSYMWLNLPVNIGDYKSETSPDKPILLHMVRTPCQAGLSEFDQNRAGRAELLATSLEDFERETRKQLAQTLAGSDFDASRDITAITINRWPHGYAPEYNSLWEPDVADGEQPAMLARQPFGRISIANSDAGWAAYTDSAIDQAYRAVDELLGKFKGKPA